MIFIGIPNKNRKFVRYNFNESINNIDIRNFLEDALAFKTTPKLSFDMYAEIKSNNIEVMFDERYVNPETIEKFFAESNISIHRSTPFYFELHPLNKIINIIFILLTPFFFLLFKPIDLLLKKSKK